MSKRETEQRAKWRETRGRDNGKNSPTGIPTGSAAEFSPYFSLIFRDVLVYTTGRKAQDAKARRFAAIAGVQQRRNPWLAQRRSTIAQARLPRTSCNHFTSHRQQHEYKSGENKGHCKHLQFVHHHSCQTEK
ncbi:hypothetical protein [Desulfobulbus sp.]|uniref:hypothetical protein n=1 Tax=Desulfobulbus sp. TaxID=895 RepID=UPI0027B97B68|nr:hypothetical protein [Desulfobulbus sp.]